MKKINKFLPLIFTLLLVFATSITKADDPGNPNDVLGGGGSGVTAEGVPLDGGVSLLALAGGSLALKRLRKKKAK